MYDDKLQVLSSIVVMVIALVNRVASAIKQINAITKTEKNRNMLAFGLLTFSMSQCWDVRVRLCVCNVM